VRDSIESVVAEWFARHTTPQARDDDKARRELVRELLIVASTPRVRERTQVFINRAVAVVRDQVEGGHKDAERWNDPRPIMEKWLNASDVPFWQQKIIQWFMAYVYGHGFRHGKRAGPGEEYTVHG
jgi:hypothetical protein